MRVEQVMTKDVASCDVEDRLNTAATIMWERDCGAVPVVARASEGRVVGMITDRDVCMAAYTTGRSLAELHVYDAMSRSLHGCKPGDTLGDAEAIMRDAQVRRLPVIDDAGNLAGILSLADVVRTADEQRAAKRPEVDARRVTSLLAAIVAPHAEGIESATRV